MQTPENHLLAEIEQERKMISARPIERFWNRTIDGIGMCLLFFLLMNLSMMVAAKQIVEDDSGYQLIFFFCFIFLPLIYYTLMEGVTKGRTLGKLITKTKVVKVNGDPIGFKEAAIRSISRIIPFDGISTFFGGPWHDQFSKTKVIKVD